MANAVISWDQRPEFLAFTDWTPIPGVTSYTGRRNGTGTNVTQFHPGHAFLSEHNLPNIMYKLRPCDEWKRFKDSPLPGPKHNPDGSLVYEQWTRPGTQRQTLRDFKILPDKASFMISTEEGWWYHEFVRRMDPRIRQRDIIMREEASAERSRMSDQRYINIHLNTPGYRIYRPAWKMIAWHMTAAERQNDRKQQVLDELTDAQKQANTTRGSTPGLINPALGDFYGNRVPLPDLKLKKRGPKRATVNANNTPATQPVQPVQVPQAPQAPQAPQTPNGYQNGQFPQPLRASSSNVGTASFPGASANMGAPFQNFASMAYIPGQKDARGYANTQARDAAAMPPPLLPFKPQNSHPQVFGSHPDPPYSIYQPPLFDNTQANLIEEEDFGTLDNHVPEPTCTYISDEEIATMAARSEEAMAEIHWMCEPFLDPGSNFPEPPPMDLSAELIDDLGISCMSPNQAGEVRVNGNEDTMPNPAQTTPARNVAQQTTPMLSEKQGTKRKERDDGNENFQDVQLDVERQAQRPIKRVKSVHAANLQNNNTAFHHNAAHNSQRQQHLAPQLEDYQSGYTPWQVFNRPALQGNRQVSVEDTDPHSEDGLPKQDIDFFGQNFNHLIKNAQPQRYTSAPFGTGFPVPWPPHQRSLVSPYIPGSSTTPNYHPPAS